MPKRSSPEPLRRALALAARGRYTTSPNPMVGAVVVRRGRIVGEGWHVRAGEAHAEVIALADAGDRARGATLHLNLEPCVHHGRTPPCVDAIVRAGIARVVACHRDPDPRVAGRGFARLAESGIAMEVGALADAALRLNWRFLAARVFARPAVTLKWAMTLDGRVATAHGESRWITGEAARRWALELREEHDAIAVGSGTVLADDPRLDRRLGLAPGPIVRVVLDRRLRVPPTAQLFDVRGPVVVFTESRDAAARKRLAARGAEVVTLARVDPAAVLVELKARGIESLLVEGGPVVAGAFFDAGLFDRVAIGCGAKLVGGRTAPGPLGGEGITALESAPRIVALRTHRRGGELVLEGFRESCLQALSSNVAA